MRLAVSGLSFAHGAGAQRLENIGFVLDPGEVLCVLGPNGAGKTTLLRCLIGALTPSGGSILLDGRPVAGLDLHHPGGEVELDAAQPAVHVHHAAGLDALVSLVGA